MKENIQYALAIIGFCVFVYFGATFGKWMSYKMWYEDLVIDTVQVEVHKILDERGEQHEQ